MNIISSYAGIQCDGETVLIDSFVVYDAQPGAPRIGMCISPINLEFGPLEPHIVLDVFANEQQQKLLGSIEQLGLTKDLVELIGHIAYKAYKIGRLNPIATV